jgi:hypothetical protein
MAEIEAESMSNDQLAIRFGLRSLLSSDPAESDQPCAPDGSPEHDCPSREELIAKREPDHLFGRRDWEAGTRLICSRHFHVPNPLPARKASEEARGMAMPHVHGLCSPSRGDTCSALLSFAKSPPNPGQVKVAPHLPRCTLCPRCPGHPSPIPHESWALMRHAPPQANSSPALRGMVHGRSYRDRGPW